jgi:uncharacterized metal-binding protein YceD (DUF177 family)
MTGQDHNFRRMVNPAGRSAPGSYDIEANEAERQSLARWLDIPAVNSLTATLRLSREAGDAVTVLGTFKARVDLVCGVTLENFAEAVTGDVEAVFRKDAAVLPPVADADVEINLETDEPRPWTVHGVDLGALLAEELSLALPDFPRKPEADLTVVEGAPAEEPRPNPFAVLARLPRTEG